MSPKMSVNGTLINNQTLYNWSGDTNGGEMDTLDGALSYWFNIIMVCELSVSTCCNVVALTIMMRCRRLPISIKYLSINFLICFLATGSTNMILTVTRLVLGPNFSYELINDLRTFLVSVFTLVLWCSMCALTVERFIAIVFPYQYILYVTKTTVYVTISLTWTLSTIIPSVILFVTWLKICGQYDYIYLCDIFAIFRPFKIYLTSLLCIAYAITIVMYTKILLIIRHLEREIHPNILASENYIRNNPLSTPFPSTKIILTIILSFIVLQFPYIFSTAIYELRSDMQQRIWRVIFQFVSYICLELNTFVTLYLYIWRIQECRMQFYQMFSHVSNRYREKAEALRIEVFNIVTFERHSNYNTEF